MTCTLHLNNKSISAAWSGRSGLDEQVQLWLKIYSFAYVPMSPYPHWATWVQDEHQTTQPTSVTCSTFSCTLLSQPPPTTSPHTHRRKTVQWSAFFQQDLDGGVFLFLSLPLNWYLIWKGGKGSHSCSPKSQNAALSFSTWIFARCHLSFFSFFQ